MSTTLLLFIYSHLLIFLELVVHHGEQDLTLSLPEPQLVVEEEVVSRKKRGNATQLPSAYKKVETVEHVPRQLEKYLKFHLF
jgi:hypothetical protein